MSIFDHFTPQELEILQKRAERLARPVVDRRIDNPLEVLIVVTGNESYALPTDMITGVYENITIVPVPCVPAHIVGVANIRGHILPVINLATFLNISSEGKPSGTLVIVSHEEFNVAFLVAEASTTKIISLSSVSQIPETVHLAQRRHLKGLLADGTALLDIGIVLDESLQQVQASTT